MPGELGMEDLAQTSGPNASLDYGQAKELQDLKRTTTAHGAQGGPPGPPAQGGPPPGGGPPQGGPAAQPPPPKQSLPMSLERAQQGFSTPPPEHTGVAWRDGLKALATHPAAGPTLRGLLARSKGDQ